MDKGARKQSEIGTEAVQDCRTGNSYCENRHGKSRRDKKKIVVQNASMCADMKIKRIFWLSALKKDKRTSSLVIEVDDAKMANMLIEEGLVLDHTLHGCMRYNPACRIKQCFNCYEYGHVSVHCQKSTKCGACSGPHRTLECPQDKAQKCLLGNGAHTSWDKQYEHRKKKYLRIEAAKQNHRACMKSSQRLILQGKRALGI